MSFLDRCRKMDPQLRLFLAGMMCLGVAGGIFETTFNNFLSDLFDIGADARGRLEFPRELPGFLTALLAGALFFLPETMVAAAAALVVALGMFGLALWGERWGLMVAFMILWSAGTHLMMPIRSSIGLILADKQRKGRRLGQVAAAGFVAVLLGAGLVLLVLGPLRLGYVTTFTLGGLSALAASGFFLAMRLPNAHLHRSRFVWRRPYWLFYVLCLLFGARKQIFITFGPWVLVRVFDQPATIIAQLWVASAILGMLLHPLLGQAIDRLGERRILVADSLCVFLVCAGYAYSDLIGNRQAALWILYACYVGDHLLFGVNMARSTYLSKIVLQPADLSPTLSLGITINHAVSMTVPVFGGWLWVTHGHSSVFQCAACIAILMLVFSSLIRVPRAA